MQVMTSFVIAGCGASNATQKEWLSKLMWASKREGQRRGGGKKAFGTARRCVQWRDNSPGRNQWLDSVNFYRPVILSE